MQHYELPLIAAGRLIEAADGGERYVFYNDDVEFAIPRLDDLSFQAIRDADGIPLRNCSVNDIIGFLSRIGKLWRDDDYPLRRLLLDLGPKATGESVDTYRHSLDLFIGLISTKAYLGDIIDAELRNRLYLDEWVPYHNVYLRAEPLGRLLHIIVGNVPVASVYSLVRGILTKNVNIAKLPSRDVVTLSLFARSFFDLAPEHPITKTTSVVYWDRNEDQWIDRFMDIAHGLCIWGGEKSVEIYKSKARIGVEVIEYGPKLGAQIIRWNEADAGNLPIRVAHDIAVFDQEACFCPQIIYLEGNIDSFIEALSEALERYTKIWPKGQYEVDHYAHMNYVKLAHLYKGGDVRACERLSWLIVKLPVGHDIALEHPLGRTIYVRPVHDVRECVQFLDCRNQTVGVDPIEVGHELKDALAERGVQRISNIGYVDIPRLGLGHDGKYLDRLVRWAALERERDFNCKIYDVPYEEKLHNTLVAD
ncbi:acyl-CoA reductase [Sulfuriferula plumbiphila]|uniref:Acyl-CoA reductase n=1 Tax=Sulfuriferula plumbiphila TaxID=171865 RepID=A0A512L6X7_9PROT|nr:acyl-CoA reductase [Sulfuriferula plumbiphila]BBP02936.1 acyl-CoA reductase [Sulfuriferula plumbiphila]GEP30197.1 acyl-CoA reductase [Sulfuriferula plumbiphila]